MVSTTSTWMGRYGPLVMALLPASLVHGKYISVDQVVLAPQTVKAEVHAIKGSGGQVSINELLFQQTAGSQAMAVDVFLFKVPNECPDHSAGTTTSLTNAAEACFLKNSGLGSTQGGTTTYCCTQELLNAGQCTQAKRAITPYTYQGDHRYVSLLPGGNPKNTYLSSVDEAAQYALVFMNCDDTGTAQLNGKITWDSYPGGFEVWEEAELELGSDLEQIAEKCGIDTGFFTDGPSYDEDEDGDMAFMNSVEEYLATLTTVCSADEVETLNAAFDDFHKCAGFDLQLFIEDLPSAVLGTALECLVTMDWDQFKDIDWNDLDEVANIEVSESCLDFEFGDNAVGYGLRQMSLFPDKTMTCLKTFSPKVPKCNLEVHPIPILGGLLKPATCVVGELQSILDDVLKIEMGIWKNCLPADPKKANCENDCLYEGSVLMRGGNMALPVSDTMIRLAAADGGLQTALDRYKLHLKECTDEWSGWTAFEGAATQQADRHKVSSTSSSASSSGSNDGGGSRGLFDFAMLLVGLCVGAVIAVGYERAQRRKAFKHTEKQLELTEGTYADNDSPYHGPDESDNNII